MDELIEEMVSYVEANGGRVLWADMVANMDGRQYGNIPKAFATAKSRKRLSRQVTRTAEGLVLEVFIPGK